MRIQKKDLLGEVVFEYEGKVLKREDNAIVIEAFFGREDVRLMNVVLKNGDRFLETFYTDRWYNVFEIHDREDGTLKGWYCNIGKPAVVANDVVSYVDLALDLWVAPDGTQTVLDADEFERLNLDIAVKKKACAALHELQEWFKSKIPAG